MSGFYTEAHYENSVIELFRNVGYTQSLCTGFGARFFYIPLHNEEVEDSLQRINKGAPYDAISEALFKLHNFENGQLVQKHAIFMNYMQNGIDVRYQENGESRSMIIYLVDYKSPDNNSFIVSNQWTFV